VSGGAARQTAHRLGTSPAGPCLAASCARRGSLQTAHAAARASFSKEQRSQTQFVGQPCASGDGDSGLESGSLSRRKVDDLATPEKAARHSGHTRCGWSPHPMCEGRTIERSGAHASHTTAPHPRQWCRQRSMLNGCEHAMHSGAASSATHVTLLVPALMRAG
jgi:hypothetical protein